MTLDAIIFTVKVLSSFLKYQLPAYPFADEHLHQQMLKEPARITRGPQALKVLGQELQRYSAMSPIQFTAKQLKEPLGSGLFERCGATS